MLKVTKDRCVLQFMPTAMNSFAKYSELNSCIEVYWSADRDAAARAAAQGGFKP